MKKSCSRLIACLILLCRFTAAHTQQNAAAAINTNLLWYKDSASDWNEALPIGNGFLGAMVFGNVQREHLQLNENTLYSGEPSLVYKKVSVVSTLDSVTGLLRAHKNATAEEFIRKNW